MFDMVINTPPSNRDSIWYYNAVDIRAFLSQRSMPTTKLTSKVTNNSFKAWFFLSLLLTALESGEKNI